MIINARSSNFIFNFPKSFIIPPIEDKYKNYVMRMPLPYDTVQNFMNAHVQSITFPSLAMEPVTQARKLGKEQAYKSGKVTPDLFTKEMTVTMKAVDGYINYWIFLENALNYLDFSTKDLYLEDMYIRVLSQEGHIVQTVRFQKVILTGVSEIVLSYSDTTPTFSTFNATFKFNALDIFVEHD